MHTFLKRADGTFQIGMWLPIPSGFAKFTAIAEVNSLMAAMQVVNYLNGGDGDRSVSIANNVRIETVE